MIEFEEACKMLPKYITKYLHAIAKSEGFSDYKFEVKSGSNHGDNFLGVMIAVKVIEINPKIHSNELHLICKTPPANQFRRKFFKTDIVFERELFMYSKVLPAFHRFQEERGLNEIDQFRSHPKVYACEADIENDTYILIMEDLRWKNYEMWPKEAVVPLANQLLVMRELGKFHAISFAMKDQRPNEFEMLKPPTNDPFSQLVLHGKLSSFSNKSIARAVNALNKSEHKRLMSDFGRRFVETVDNLLQGPISKEFGVINHGDCWNNNMLFQYSNDDVSSEVILKFRHKIEVDFNCRK